MWFVASFVCVKISMIHWSLQFLYRRCLLADYYVNFTDIALRHFKEGIITLITSNVIHRIFRIKYENGVGTCFTIDEGNQRYLITAKHIVENIVDHDTVEIYYNNNWENLEVNLIGHGSTGIDISVLTGDLSFSVDHPLPASMAHLCYSQDVYFLGFPNIVNIDKLAPSIQKMNNNFHSQLQERELYVGSTRIIF